MQPKYSVTNKNYWPQWETKRVQRDALRTTNNASEKNIQFHMPVQYVCQKQISKDVFLLSNLLWEQNSIGSCGSFQKNLVMELPQNAVNLSESWS